MHWFWLSLATAATQAVKDTFLKAAMGRTDPTLAMFLYSAGAAMFLWLFAAPTAEVVLAPSFWPLLALGGALGGLTYWLYGLALSRGDLSLTLPMLAFTPLFLLVTSPLALGEFPDTPGLVGMLCVVAGSYVLNLRERRKGLLGPVRALWTNPGARLMLLVAAIWSIGANLDKMGLRASSPEFWIAAVYTASSLALLPGVLGRSRGIGRQLLAAPAWLVAAGLLEAVGLLCQMQALTLAMVPYVIAVKRTSIVFGVLLGAAFFHEPDLLYRLPGALLMAAGVFFIAVFG